MYRLLQDRLVAGSDTITFIVNPILRQMVEREASGNELASQVALVVALFLAIALGGLWYFRQQEETSCNKGDYSIGMLLVTIFLFLSAFFSVVAARDAREYRLHPELRIIQRMVQP